MSHWKRNPIYNLEDSFYFVYKLTEEGAQIKRVKAGIVRKTEQLSQVAGSDGSGKLYEYAKKVAVENPEFNGKIVIKYQDDHIGKGPGNAKWVHVYNCKNGQVTYIGNAIHKEADPDYQESGYNEVLWSQLGKVVLDEEYVKVPKITCLNDEYFEGNPAILSYNIVDTRIEEMIQMDTIVYNSTERRNVHDNRVTLPQILQAVEIETKKVLKNVKGRAVFNLNRYVQDMQIQMCDEGEEGNTKLQRRVEVLSIISDIIEKSEEPITMKSLVEKVLERCSEKISEERIRRYIIENPVYLEGSIKEINEHMKNQKINYANLEKGILHTALLDAITNNIDRHLSNWAIIRNKNTGKCLLGVFDNTLSFIDMSSVKPFAISGKWSESSIYIEPIKKCTSQEEVCEYIARNYPEQFADFIDIMKDKLPEYSEAIGMPKISDEEYKLLADEEKAQCGSYIKPVLDDVVIEKLTAKVRMLKVMLRETLEIQVDTLSKEYLANDGEEKPIILEKLNTAKRILERINQKETLVDDER